MKPTARDLGRGNLEKKIDSFARGDIDIVLASFAMHSDGQIPGVQVEKLRSGCVSVRSPTNRRCVRYRARQSGAAQLVNQMLGQLARDQGPLRRIRSGRAPSDYGRALVTKMLCCHKESGTSSMLSRAPTPTEYDLLQYASMSKDGPGNL